MARCAAIAALVIFFRVTGSWAQSGVVLQTVVTGLNEPVYLTHSHDGTNRRFILEQPGRILVMQPGVATTSGFLDIRTRVLSGGERGLLGLAFHPQFSFNQRFFVNYTRQPDGATVVAEYRVSGTSPNLADPASEKILLVVDQPFPNHNGGMIEFGPDNLLYIGMGDGGSANDPGNRAQNTNELLGKILRIDVDRPASATVLYSSPESNPFAGPAAGRDEIYAYGLRNPWRFSFDRLNGQLFVGDVGQGAAEEIDIVTRGGNYGWRVLEGTTCTNLGPASCSTPGFLPPIAAYSHGGGRCSVTGGYVYRGTRPGLPYGAYIYGDFCSGEIFALQGGTPALLMDTTLSISSFGEDEAGEIYVVDLGGSIHWIVTNGIVDLSQRRFSTPDRGGESLSATGVGTVLTTGSARIRADNGSALPGGLAVFTLRERGILITEGSVPIASPIANGRFLAFIGGARTTGLAIANPNAQPVTLEFFFTDSAGQDFGRNATIIPAGGQISAFLNQSPFSGGASIDGTFTFSVSGGLVSAMALSGLFNQRSEFLFTSIPIVQVSTGSVVPTTFAHWAQGEGWATEFGLVNPTDQTLSGSLELRTPDGQLRETLPYAIPQRSSRRLVSPRVDSTVQVGSARIVPLVGATPSGVAIFTLTTGAGAITEAGIPAIPAGTAFRGYGEVSAAVRTGVAVANLSTSSANVRVDLTPLDGTGTVQTGTITLQPNGQKALFLNEIDGLTSMAAPFQGMMRVTSTLPVAVTALRTRINQRGEFLITASAPVDESVPITGSELLFPHLAIGSGYDMQFLLLNSQPVGGQSGTIYFFAPDGGELHLFVR